jgi:hypothetical protein
MTRKALHALIDSADFERFESRASAAGLSVAGLVRRLAYAFLDNNPAAALVTERPSGKSRERKVRLTVEEMAALEHRATIEGVSPGAWIVRVLRANLLAKAQPTPAELDGLRAATEQLAAVGRNLNAAIHRMHREGREQALPVVELREAVANLREEAAAVIVAATSRYRSDR